MKAADQLQEPVKDETSEYPVATAWRPTLREIVKAFAAGDYALANGIDSVTPVTSNSIEQMRRYIADYGETLVELPDDTWITSISLWTGTHWDLIVDLWTAESGRSDMILDARVFEREDGFRIEIHAVYVP